LALDPPAHAKTGARPALDSRGLKFQISLVITSRATSD
jgi:hypothetical protein